MAIASAKWFRGLLLSSIYVLGVLGIVGSAGGGGSDACWSFDAPCEPLDYPSTPPNWPPPSGDWPPPPLPPSPSSTSGFNSTVLSIAPAVDSSDDIYVGGDFTSYKNSEANRVARLNNDGSLDTGFVTGTGFDARTSMVSPTNDGSGDVYVGGSFTSYNGTAVGEIVRLNLDGTLDTGFSTGTGFTNRVNVIAPTNDGSGDVYVGGYFTSYNGINVGNGIIRLNNDGSLDTGFSTGSGWGAYSFSPAIDGSGDVYVTRASAPGIARLNDDGSIDPGFDTGLTGFDDFVRRIAVATDGSGDVYVTGDFNEYNGTASASGLVRLNNDGTLDAGFLTDPGYNSRGSFFITPAIDGSNDIYVGSNFIDRLNDDGSIDTGFDANTILLNGSSLCAALALDGSGDVYVGGSFTNIQSGDPANLARFTSEGAFAR